MLESPALPALADWTIAVVVLIALTAGAILACILALPRERMAGEQRLGANADLRWLLDDIDKHTIPAHQRPQWFVGTLVAIGFFAVLSFVAQNDERALSAERIAERALADTRLPVALRNLRCPPANAPLENLLVTIGTQADGKKPELHCTYITADLGVVPRIRFGKPQVIAER